MTRYPVFELIGSGDESFPKHKVLVTLQQDQTCSSTLTYRYGKKNDIAYNLHKMQDIEDIGSVELRRESYSLPMGLYRWRPRSTDKPETTLTEGIPRTQAIHVKTWGCSHNNSDGEYMAGMLSQAGYNLVEPDQADLWVLNGCTVKNPSEEAFRNMIKKAVQGDVKLVLAGCVPQADSRNPLYERFSMIGVNQLDRIVEVVEETLKGNQVQLMRRSYKKAGDRLDLPKIRKNKLIEILPINSGCLNNCTYCKTKAARGDLRSYPTEEILDRVRQVVKDGVIEIWLSSEDTGTYGRDLYKENNSLTNMLRQVLGYLEREAPHVMVRLGMSNPPYIYDCIEEISELFHHPNLYCFLHIPIQSGNDKVLHQMGRGYSVADFEYLVDLLMERVPDIHIATDVICGFPNETTEEFRDTLNILEKYQFITVNISQFYPRKGTPAADAPQLDSTVKKTRSRMATECVTKYSPYSQYMGRTFKVTCTESAHYGDYYVSHNKYYHQILIPNKEEYMGKSLEVRIVEVSRYHMKGIPV